MSLGHHSLWWLEKPRSPRVISPQLQSQAFKVSAQEGLSGRDRMLSVMGQRLADTSDRG